MVTIGTETLGSIVSPSTRCGATGLRPTFGTVSRSGAMVLCWSLIKPALFVAAQKMTIVYYYLKGTDGKDASAVDHAFNFNQKADIKSCVSLMLKIILNGRLNDSLHWKVLDVL
jgi:Asp-tRNA(Asn)/Glu-tRNA(Gln) amidotransferase A subunit family amidase